MPIDYSLYKDRLKSFRDVNKKYFDTILLYQEVYKSVLLLQEKLKDKEFSDLYNNIEELKNKECTTNNFDEIISKYKEFLSYKDKFNKYNELKSNLINLIKKHSIDEVLKVQYINSLSSQKVNYQNIDELIQAFNNLSIDLVKKLDDLIKNNNIIDNYLSKLPLNSFREELKLKIKDIRKNHTIFEIDKVLNLENKVLSTYSDLINKTTFLLNYKKIAEQIARIQDIKFKKFKEEIEVDINNTYKYSLFSESSLIIQKQEKIFEDLAILESTHLRYKDLSTKVDRAIKNNYANIEDTLKKAQLLLKKDIKDIKLYNKELGKFIDLEEISFKKSKANLWLFVGIKNSLIIGFYFYLSYPPLLLWFFVASTIVDIVILNLRTSSINKGYYDASVALIIISTIFVFPLVYLIFINIDAILSFIDSILSFIGKAIAILFVLALVIGAGK